MMVQSHLRCLSKMLKHAHHQGVKEIVNTIHYQHPLFMHIDFSVQRFEKIKILYN